MRDFKSLFFVLLTLSFAAMGFAQPGQMSMYYFDDPPGTAAPLGSPCETPSLHPFADGVNVCVYWDRDNNGPDNSDVQPDTGQGYGQVNQRCFALNGTLGGMGPGYFSFDDPAFEVREVPSGADSPSYWLQVNSGGFCWRTRSFTGAPPGFNSIQFVQTDWTCVATACPNVVIPVPNAPTNVTATRDSCLQETVTWQHDGLHETSGYAVFNQDDVAVGPTAAPSARSLEFDVTTDAPQKYCVKALNAAGSSAPSDSASGSAYLIRFADDASGDISGSNLANTAFTLHFRTPTETCHSGIKLYLIYWDQSSHSFIEDPRILASDSLTTQIHGHFFGQPADTNKNCCKIVMRDSSFDSHTIFDDTTASVFNLGSRCILAAGETGGFIPEQFSLSQNFPNPFNPTTEIQFNVPVQANIRLRIYNIMGQEVRTLTEGVYSPGVHTLTWDGKSNGGISVGAGVYLYRMEAPGYMMTKKMLLLK